MPTTTTCKTCGKTFSHPPSDQRVYCGRPCFLIAFPPRNTHRTHGASYTRLHALWCSMKNRCQPTHPAAQYYAQRAITVCDEWKQSFIAFQQWAITNGYSDDLQIDRRDNDRGYEPSNCRWVTRHQQMRNTGKRRNAQTSTYKGVSKHQNKWRAQIHTNHRTTYLGLFLTEIEAAHAYDKAARERFGVHASPNFKEV